MIKDLKEIILAVVAVIGYLCERNKREKVTEKNIELKAELKNQITISEFLSQQVSQNATQQVSQNLQPTFNIINKLTIPEEDKKAMMEEIVLAVNKSSNALSIAAQPIALAAITDSAAANILRAKTIGGETPSLDKFFEKHPELLTPEQKSKKAFNDWKEKKKS